MANVVKCKDLGGCIPKTTVDKVRDEKRVERGSFIRNTDRVGSNGKVGEEPKDIAELERLTIAMSQKAGKKAFESWMQARAQGTIFSP